MKPTFWRVPVKGYKVSISLGGVDKLFPRSLLTPFTDNVSLTAGDEAAYAAQAQAQRSKGFQDIAVTFDNPADAGPDDETTTAERSDQTP